MACTMLVYFPTTPLSNNPFNFYFGDNTTKRVQLGNFKGNCTTTWVVHNKSALGTERPESPNEVDSVVD